MKSILLSALVCILSLQSINAQWQQVYGGPYIYSLGALGNNIFMGNANGVHISTNSGNNWSQTSFNTSLTALSLALSGTNILAGTYTAGVYYSTNNGINWSQSSLNNRAIRSILSADVYVYAGTENNGVYISSNNGMNWTPSSINNRTVRSFAALSGNIFAGTDSFGVYISTNNGSAWSQTALNNQSIYCMTVNGNEIYAGTRNGVFKSTNTGINWIQSMNAQHFTGLIVSGGSVFAVAYSGGSYVSNDNGASWIQRNEGLGGNTFMGSLIILNNNLFAGSAPNVGVGIYRRPVSELIGINQISTELPNSFSLEQNYPNPFNPVTNIKFSVPKSAFVKLAVYDISGREIEKLVSDKLSAGSYNADWDASKYSSGIYFYTITSGSYRETKKMLMVK